MSYMSDSICLNLSSTSCGSLCTKRHPGNHLANESTEMILFVACTLLSRQICAAFAVFYFKGSIWCEKLSFLFDHVLIFDPQVDKMIGASVKSCGQRNLADDGKRVWDDEIRSRLDIESFKGASNDADVGRKAEEKLYHLLHERGQNSNEPMFVVHSFDFSEHVPRSERKRSWVMGESDFVVIHRRHGPIFFQVKATETGKKYKEAEVQIRKDKLALENFFKKMEQGNISSKKVTEEFKNCPGFVVMPNCPRGLLSACIQDNVICQEDCSSSEAFSRWWDEKIESAKHPPHNQTVFEHLVMR